jgi:polyhydroxyalkanoate synthesis regulator phasin
LDDDEALKQLVGVGNEVAVFVAENMKTTVDRIVKHNETMMSLPVSEAKRFRQEFLLREKQHDSWCKQKIKSMMSRRPPPPFPFC